MRVLTVVGKVDTRVLVYPLARALSLTGLTAIVADDGAYRRLFKGKGLKGTVSGVDVSIGLNMDVQLKNSLNNSGVPYDNLIVVSSNYIPKDSDGVIVCHGVDNSFGTVEEEPKQVEAFEEPKKKRGLGKKSDDSTQEESVNLDKNDESALDDFDVDDNVVNDNKEDTDDSFEIPENIPSTEIYISYNKPIDKFAKGILLRDGYMQYIYSCEEKKILDKFADKNVNKHIASIAAPVLNIDAKELEQLLGRDEYTKDTKRSK